MSDPSASAPGSGGRPDPATYDYSKPSRNCDVVMKGGITSGVVYPFAVCEMARTYRFKSIGGTSAGAIAAAATAAAEYGRASGGFQKLARLPRWLGAGSNLLGLFAPTRATRRVFDVFTAPIGQTKGRAGKIAVAAARAFAGWLLLGALPGAVALVLGIAVAHGLLRGLLIGLAVTLVPLGAVAGVGVGLLRAVGGPVVANGFGLSSGMGDGTPGTSPLTEWLAATIDDIAGRGPATDRPLTLGDLWTGPEPGTAQPDAGPSINLQVMSTNLSQGRPYRLPFDGRQWFFDPIEFRGLFPERVVTWMERHPPALPAQPARARWESLQRRLLEPLRPLPQADLPVVVAARMSLSFPLLISAVPLYAVDWSRTANQDAGRRWQTWLAEQPDGWEPPASAARWQAVVRQVGPPPTAAKNWFSDGGITSNFPVHFFDAPIPRWPTFAINLREYHPDHLPTCDECAEGQAPCDQCQSVWMPADNRGGILESWRDIPEAAGVRSLASFGHAILDTMQNWMDNTQLRVPGYRDRVAHVRHSKEEGGINLNMPECRITALTERGRCAGAELVSRFSGSPPPGTELTWDNHRWVRYRTTMSLLQDLFTRFRGAFDEDPVAGDPRFPPPGDATYRELLDSGTPPSYPLGSQLQFAQGATDGVLTMSRQWDASGDLSRDAPAPQPELRVRPRI